MDAEGRLPGEPREWYVNPISLGMELALTCSSRQRKSQVRPKPPPPAWLATVQEANLPTSAVSEEALAAGMAWRSKHAAIGERAALVTDQQMKEARDRMKAQQEAQAHRDAERLQARAARQEDKRAGRTAGGKRSSSARGRNPIVGDFVGLPLPNRVANTLLEQGLVQQQHRVTDEGLTSQPGHGHLAGTDRGRHSSGVLPSAQGLTLDTSGPSAVLYNATAPGRGRTIGPSGLHLSQQSGEGQQQMPEQEQTQGEMGPLSKRPRRG